MKKKISILGIIFFSIGTLGYLYNKKNNADLTMLSIVIIIIGATIFFAIDFFSWKRKYYKKNKK